MPRTQVTFVWRHSSASSFHSCFWAQMRDDHVIPCVAILMAKDNEMVWHWLIGIWRLQPIAQLSRCAESGLGEMDMINVGAFTGSGGCGTLFVGLCCFLRMNDCNGQEVK